MLKRRVLLIGVVLATVAWWGLMVQDVGPAEIPPFKLAWFVGTMAGWVLYFLVELGGAVRLKERTEAELAEIAGRS